MKLKILTLLAVLAVVGACVATTDRQKSLAGHDKRSLMAAHKDFDSMGAAFFAMMDADANGIVTREERAQAPHQEWMADFSRVDLDGNGELTQEEYLRALRKVHSEPRLQEV